MFAIYIQYLPDKITVLASSNVNSKIIVYFVLRLTESAIYYLIFAQYFKNSKVRVGIFLQWIMLYQNSIWRGFDRLITVLKTPFASTSMQYHLSS